MVGMTKSETVALRCALYHLTLQLTTNQMSGETGVACCTNLYFNSALRILNMLQCCINIKCHHQARCEP